MEKILKIIRYSTIAGIFLIPFLPVVISSSLFFPFITGKNFLFRIIVELIFVLWAVLAVNDKRYRPKKSWILIFLTIFVAAMVLSTIFGENLYRSFWSNFERMEGLVTYLHLLAYFLVLTTVLNTEKLWKWFFHVFLGVGVITAFYGILQLIGEFQIHQSDVRLDATLGNASYLAIYMVFNIFLAGLYFLKTKQWYKWFYGFPIVLYLIVLYNTATRGSILGLIGGIVLSIILIAFFSKNRRIRTISVSSFVLILILILLSIFLVFKDSTIIKQSPVLSRFANISLEDTTQSRFVIWKMSWEGFKEKPILGWGPENYNLVFNKYYDPVLYKQEPWFDRAHNIFFDRLTTNGLIGLLAYLGLFASSFYYLIVKRKKYDFSVYSSVIIISLFAAYFFNNIFVFDNIISLVFFFSFLSYIHSKATREYDFERENINENKLAVSSAIAIIALVFIVYFINIPGYLSSKNLLGALESAAGGNTEEAFERFEKSLSYNSFGRSETREQFVNFASKVVKSSIDQDLKIEIINSAEQEMEKQVSESSGDIRYMLFLASFYNTMGKYDEAIDVLNQIIELSPKKQVSYFELTSSYLNKKEYKKAMEIARIAFDLEPSYTKATEIYAIAAVYAGEIELGEMLLNEEYGTYIISDIRLVNAYASVSEFEKVAEIWEIIIEKNPDNMQYRMSLAATYLQIGERQKSIEELQKAIEINPEFKQQGEYYINEIKAGRNP